MDFLRFAHERPYAVYALFAITLVYVMNQLDRYLFGVAKIPFVDYQGGGYSSLAGPLFTLVYTISGVGFGLFADRGNRVICLVVALTFWSIMTLLVAFTTKFWEVALARVGQGLGEAGCMPFASCIIADYFPGDVRGTALGIYTMGIYLGYSTAMSVGTYMSDTIGWRLSYIIPGAAGIAISVGFYLTVREPQRSRTNLTTNTPQESDGNVNVRSILILWAKHCSLILLCISGGVRNASGYVWANYAPIFFSSMYEVAKDPVSSETYTCSVSWNPQLGPRPEDCSQSPNYRWCISGQCSRVSASPWHNVGLSHSEFEAYMSWIPLVAGSLGAVSGGYVSDKLMQRYGPAARISVLVMSNLLAAPFAFWALDASNPWCFVALVPMNIIGEMFVSVCLAIVVDIVPSSMRATSIAIYMFIITNIGGNAPVLVPYVKRLFEGGKHTFEIRADDGVYHEVSEGAEPLRKALMCMFPSLYIVSAALFVFVYMSVRRDVRLRRAMETEEGDEPQMKPLLS